MSDNSYRAVLAALNVGTVVSFNNSGGANAKGTRELKVESAGDAPYFEGSRYRYTVAEAPNGELELLHGEKDSPDAPGKVHDTIETIEVIAEPPE